MATRLLPGSRPTGLALPLLMVFLATFQFLAAAPFKKQIQFTQPDGTHITVAGQGDDFYAVFETIDGYTVVFDQSQKAYCYAQLSPDAAQLFSTGVQVQQPVGATLGLPPHLRLSPEAIKQQVAQRYAAWNSVVNLSARWSALKAQTQAAGSGAEFAPPGSPTVGSKLGLTLLIDFDDAPATVPQADIIDFCNGDTYTGFGNNGSVKKYFSDNSNGKLTYSNVVTIYIRAPKLKSVYNDTSADAGLQARMLITDALNVMKALPNYDTDILPLFANLTVDNRNVAVAFNVFYAGGNGGVWSMGLWPHSWGLASAVELSPGGIKVQNYQISNIGSQLEIGTFAHENGHMLCDFPDIYDYDYDSSGGAGFFCLMNSGAYGGGGKNPVQICAYLKRAAGWTTTIDLTPTSTLVANVTALPGTNFNVIYRLPKPNVATEYYLVECRYKTNHDADLPASGVAVWHIDEKGDRDNQSYKTNSTHANYECALVQADNQHDFERNRNDGDANDLYYLGNKASGYTNYLSDFSGPNCRWWNGTPSGLVLRQFSTAGPNMSFIVGTNDPAPAILSQPQSLEAIQGLAASFSVTAAGSDPLAYQWLKNGTAIPGATSATYSIASVQSSHAGAYSVIVTNIYGSAASAPANLTVITTVPLPYALNNSNLTWTTDTTNFWFGQTNLSHDGVAAARTAPLPHGQSTALRTTVSGPGTLSFWWKVSSQPAQDTLTFRYGATDVAQISGDSGWEQLSVFLPADSQTLQWVYSKDASIAAGNDLAYVDQVSYVSGATLPFIVLQPQSQSSMGGAPIAFSVRANGTPQLSYQWFFNGGEINGATSPDYFLPNPGSQNNGAYSVRVTNPYGSVTSDAAILGVVPMAILGDNSFGQVNVSAKATNAIAIAAGAWHHLALTSDGIVLAWGDNSDGQCDVPAALHDVVGIAAGGYHSLALKADRTVTGWGADLHGQANPPAGLDNVVGISAGTWHSLAVRLNGTLVGWGDNSWGQLDPPAALGKVVSISAGGNHTLALLQSGTVAAWGENTDANGLYAGQSDVPWGLNGVVAISAGEYHSLALRTNGTVVAWGDNSYGQCAVPLGLADVAAIAAGGSHSLALKKDGTVVAWGANWNGQCTFPSPMATVLQIGAGSVNSVLLVGTPALAPTLSYPVRTAGIFTTVTSTAAGRRYALEYKNTASGTVWTSLPSVFGNGALQFLVDPSASTPQRFYRVRQW